MKRTLLFIILSSIFFACSEKRINNENTETLALTDTITPKVNSKHHDNNPNSKLIVSPDFNSIFPKDEAELAEWKRKVREEGDTSYFHKLSLCNFYNEGNYDISNDQMRDFSEMMIKKYIKDSSMSYNYKYQYLMYTTSCKSLTKVEREKGIKYAYDLLQQNKTNGLIEMQAREFIVDQYEMGKHPPKDTVIANYIKNGGQNLDSIIQVRINKP